MIEKILEVKHVPAQVDADDVTSTNCLLHLFLLLQDRQSCQTGALEGVLTSRVYCTYYWCNRGRKMCSPVWPPPPGTLWPSAGSSSARRPPPVSKNIRFFFFFFLIWKIRRVQAAVVVLQCNKCTLMNATALMNVPVSVWPLKHRPWRCTCPPPRRPWSAGWSAWPAAPPGSGPSWWTGRSQQSWSTGWSSGWQGRQQGAWKWSLLFPGTRPDIPFIPSVHIWHI